ncbi:MAG: thioredoxin family protein [Flavisolibacter sp.]
MKFLLTFLLSSTLTTPSLWLSNMQQAKTEAAQSHKYILLNFSGSDWCGPCIRMHKEIFDSEIFEKYASENLVLVNADFPRLKKNQLSKEQTNQNESLADQYNKDGKFPFTILLDTQGKVLKSWEGYPANETPAQFVDDVNSVVHAKP